MPIGKTRPPANKKSPRQLQISPSARRSAGTMLTAAGLLVAFGLYCLATRSLRATPARRVDSPGAVSSVPLAAGDEATQRAVQFLADQPWTAAAESHGSQTADLQKDDRKTFWYYKVMKQESPKVARFEPFAVVSKPKDAKPGDRWYTVVADAAHVEFERPLSLAGGNPGQVVRAGLEGEVVIKGPQELEIRGHRFFFERGAKTIYSDDPVWFRFDRHTGTAKGMQLELVLDETSKPGEALAITGVSSVKLTRSVDMTLVSDTSAQALGGRPKDDRKPSAPQPVHCQCDGSFNYYVESRIATFERNVRVRTITEPGKSDSLTTDGLLKIEFEPLAPQGAAHRPAGGKPAPPGKAPLTPVAADLPADKSQAAEPDPRALDPKLQFKRLYAEGKEKDVELVSESNALHAIMREFTYDRIAREAVLKGYRKRSAIALQQRNRIRSPEIRLVHDEQGQVTHVWGRGAGDLKHYDDKTKELDLETSWFKEMRKYPDPKSSFDLIDLEGERLPDHEALLWLPKQQSGIAADHIRLWAARSGRQSQSAYPNMPMVAGAKPGGPQLDHMLAWKNVAMLSPQLEAETEHLEIWFEAGSMSPHGTTPKTPEQRANLVPTVKRFARATPEITRFPPPPAGGGLLAPPRPTTVLLPRPAAEASGLSLASAPANSTAQSGRPKYPSADSRQPASAATTEPYNLTAASVVVRVLQGAPGEQPQVADVISKGNVHLNQAHVDGSEPLTIEGNELHVQNRGDVDQDMVVVGLPAHVRDRGTAIDGNRIRFNRLTNTSDVDGAGHLQIPVKAQTAAGASPKNNRLNVNWQEGMRFEGRTARFTANVRCKWDDGQDETEVRCRNMNVVFTKPPSFSQDRQNDERPEIESIFCDGGVEFESDSVVNEQKVEIRRGHFVQTTFHRKEGNWEATGPGTLRAWRRAENGKSGLAQFANNTRSNAPPKSRKKHDWEYVEVKFTRLMEGNFGEMMLANLNPPGTKTLQPAGPAAPLAARRGGWKSIFHDHVQLLYGPVDKPLEIINRDDLDEESGCLCCERAEFEQHPQTDSTPTYMTLLATNNSQIEGKTFFGRSNVIVYDGSTGNYRLHGADGRSAQLWRQLKPGGDLVGSSSNSIEFNPTTHVVKLDQVSGINGSK